MPHETVLLPTGDAPNVAQASDLELDAVAAMLPPVLAGLAVVWGDPAYNLVVHAGPVTDPSAATWYRWHIGLYPRVTRRAGLEIATGLAVNPARPEDTAPHLRRAMAEGESGRAEPPRDHRSAQTSSRTSDPRLRELLAMQYQFREPSAFH